MIQQSDPKVIESFMLEFSSWIGTPRIRFKRSTDEPETIDGRIRERIARAHKYSIPTVDIETTGDAARLLCLAGHYDRARSYVPSQLRDCRDVAAYCHCDVAIVAPMTARRTCRPDAVIRSENTARRRNAIDKIRAMLRYAENHGGSVSAEQLREALRAWL